MVFSLLPFARHDGIDLINLHPIVLVLIVWQQFVLPAGILSVGYYIQIDRQWLYFVLITVTSGSLFASPTLVQLMGLNQKIAVQTVVTSTIAAPFSIYLTFSLLQGEYVNLNLGLFGFRLLVFLVVPILIFMAVKYKARQWTEGGKNRLDAIGRWGSVIALVAFCFALEDQVNTALRENPDQLFLYFAVAVGVIVAVGLLTRFVMARFGAHAAMTATILTSFRNVGLTFGLVGEIAGPELAVYVGICQIPMFFSPLLFDLLFSNGASQHQKTDGAADGSDGVEGADRAEGSLDVAHNAIGALSAAANRAAMAGMAPYRGAQPINTGPISPSPRPASAHAQALAVAMPAEEPETTPEAVETYHELIGKLGSLNLEAREQVAQISHDEKARRSSYVFISVVLVFFLLGVIGVWKANKHFAPVLFDIGFLKRIAVAHINDKNFTVFDLNINIRDLRNETIALMDKAPEAVVLGASHWQEARVSSVPDKAFYNSHVHRDYYEDMLAVTEMYVRHGKLPKEMIITIRDNLLTPVKDRTDFLWLPGIKYYRAFADRIGLEPHSVWDTLPVNTWRELVSLPLLWDQAYRRFTAPVQPHESLERQSETLDTLLPGGSIVWSDEHRRLFTQARARKEALDFARARRDDPPKIDPKGIAHLEALFEFLISKGVTVTLAHPQFNPVFWEAVQGSPYMDGLKEIKELTNSWAKKYGFAVIGGFAPSDVGCTADQYIDAEHGNSKCLNLLLRQYNAERLTFDIRGTIKG